MIRVWSLAFATADPPRYRVTTFESGDAALAATFTVTVITE